MKNVIKTTWWVAVSGAAAAQPIESVDLGGGIQGFVASTENGFVGGAGDMESGWVFASERDPITDKVRTEALRPPDAAGVYLRIVLSEPGEERVCVGGHNDPRRRAVFRIDASDPLEMEEGNCVPLTPELESALEDGEKIVVRGYRPFEGQMTQSVGLDGFEQVINFVRGRRIPALDP